MQTDGFRKILVIDESEKLRDQLARFFRAHYPQVEVRLYDPLLEGRPGKDFDWGAYDLLVLEVELGGGENGLDWVATARAGGFLPATLVITGAGDEETAVRAFKVGAHGYLPKRLLNRERLVEAVTSTVEKHGREAERANTVTLRRSILNKSLFYSRLSRSVQSLPNGQFAVLYLTRIDDYSAVQSSVGLLEADRVASQVAETISQTFAERFQSASVTRIGDGTIAALILGMASTDDAEDEAALVCRHMNSLQLEGMSDPVTVSVGGICIPGGSPQAGQDWLQRADVACRMATKKPGNAYHLDLGGKTGSDGARKGDGFDVAGAIKARRIQCRYQSLASISERSAETGETLYQLRVQLIGVDGQTFAPPAVVRTPEMERMLDCWVIREALGTINAKNRAAARVGLFVRLSGPSLYDDGLLEWLDGLTRHIGNPALMGAVILELSAPDVMKSYAAAVKRVDALRDRFGLAFALVDVALPEFVRNCTQSTRFDYVRIEASLMAESGGAGGIFEQQLEAARAHDATTVVEKLESASQLTMAVGAGVDFVQGNFLQEAQDELIDDSVFEQYVV